LKALFIWVSGPDIYESQKFKISDNIEGIQYATRTLGGINQRL
jgi:hypothetical protein